MRDWIKDVLSGKRYGRVSYSVHLPHSAAKVNSIFFFKLRTSQIPIFQMYDLSFKNLFRPYTAADGMMSNVWFDRENVTPDVPEHNDSMEEMCQEVSKMIDLEVESGIPRHRVILGIFFIQFYCLCNFCFLKVNLLE